MHNEMSENNDFLEIYTAVSFDGFLKFRKMSWCLDKIQQKQEITIPLLPYFVILKEMKALNIQTSTSSRNLQYEEKFQIEYILS